MIALAHGYQTFDGPDVRVSFWPCNYELLLADVIVLDGDDVHTAWVSTASLGAFLLAVGALAERWWARGPNVVLAVLLAAGMTVVLLMSDAHKNDLMTVALFVLAVGYRGRALGDDRRAGRGVPRDPQRRDHDRHEGERALPDRGARAGRGVGVDPAVARGPSVVARATSQRGEPARSGSVCSSAGRSSSET